MPQCSQLAKHNTHGQPYIWSVPTLNQFLDRNNTIANPGFNRWLVPPAALAIHLCIGQIYAYSVFNEPMTRILGVSSSSPEDWELTSLGWIFSIALFVLGASAATFGKWVERAGPRKTMFAAALCFSGGFFISSLGVEFHQLWLIYLGHGLVGGIGLGLGYISPVSTLIKWFPDKPGLATGLAIMGFGGGAMIASPMSVFFMNMFSSSNSVGVAETFLAMGVIYLIVMIIGSYIVRVPSEDWKPEGFEPTSESDNAMITSHSVLADVAIKTPQFWFIFIVLMLNVTAGIGVLGQASVMIQEMFSEEAVGSENAIDVASAAAFVGLLSLFNMVGRFFWSSLSDKIGRKTTYGIFFALGAVLYFLVPQFGGMKSAWLFIAAFCVIISMYGGGFATVPAYLRDMFGTKQVGAIHGRLLVAWSLAAVFGPSLINYLRAYQIETVGLPASQAYSFTMYIMASLLILGFISNLLVKPVNPKYHDN